MANLSRRSGGVRDSLLAVAAAAALGFAWWFPGSIGCAVLGWISCFLIISLARSRRPYRNLLLFGLCVHALAFYWLFGTIKNFGHFPLLPALLIFLLFLFGSSLQFLLFAFCLRTSEATLGRLLLATPVAWTVAEAFSFRIFPWHMGHSQLAITPVAQIASFGSSLAISFLMFWGADAVLYLWKRRANEADTAPGSLPGAVAALGALCVLTAFGHLAAERIRNTLESNRERSFPVVLVQGNIPLDDKHDRSLVRKNVATYEELSVPYLGSAALFVWPETVLMRFLPESLGDVTRVENGILPALPAGVDDPDGVTYRPVLFGALAFDELQRFYNSAFVIQEDGFVPLPYHKQILMPFGEYTPLGDLLPWIRSINSTAADFSKGDGPVVFPVTLDGPQPRSLKVSPLICYEDVAPELSRRAVQKGAEALVNMTNDAWFGDSIAPYQHSLIASFRAIENRRFLLRATNTGLTNVLNPLGKTVAELKPFTRGAVQSEVIPINEKTLYTSLLGSHLSWGALLLWASSLICGTLVGGRESKARKTGNT